jgi:hypothetical protein
LARGKFTFELGTNPEKGIVNIFIKLMKGRFERLFSLVDHIFIS